MAATTTMVESQTAPTSNRPGRLRRLSQLRAYTQSHLIPSSSSSSSSAATSPPVASSQRRHRNSLSRVVSLTSPFHTSTEPLTAPAPSSTSSPSLERDAQQIDNSASSDSDLRGQSASSSSSRSIPSSDKSSTQAATALADCSNQTSSIGDGPLRQQQQQQQQQNSNAASETPSSTVDDVDNRNSTANKKDFKMSNTIRFFAYQDTHHSSRPSLQFSPMTRTLPSEDCVIRVGRYSERDGVPIATPSEPSDAPIGFKSKVVSRKHCEFSIVDGQWHIKDVGSSSGTFLNRTRLSQPNMASRLYAVRDGDIVQLGIDFRGGEEMIFRCVRIRIECNRQWQKRPNEFNKNTENLINNLGKGKAASDFEGCRECSICLGSVLRPYQCLFMAACAHVWHYKCIRRLIHSPDYPMFQCPNCRAWTDLSAEVDDSMEFDEESAHSDVPAAKPVDANDSNGRNNNQGRDENNTLEQGQGVNNSLHDSVDAETNDRDLATMTENLHVRDERDTPVQSVEYPDSANPVTDRQNPVSGHSQSANIPIPNNNSNKNNCNAGRFNPNGALTNHPTTQEMFEDDPMTPRNDSGPLALDGRAGHL